MNSNRVSIRLDDHREAPGRDLADKGAGHCVGASVVKDAAGRSFSPADRGLAEQVVQILRATGYLPLRNLSVTAAEGVVTLNGRVPSYYLKQVVHSAARELPGVVAVRDHLEVSSPR